KDRTARLWDVATQRPLGPPFRMEGGIWGVALGPPERGEGAAPAPRAAPCLLGAEAGQARLWRPPRGKARPPPLAHPGPGRSVGFSRDGRQALVGTKYGATLWDTAATWQRRGDFDTPGWLQGAALAPDGRAALTATWRRGTGLWDTSGPPRRLPPP